MLLRRSTQYYLCGIFAQVFVAFLISNQCSDWPLSLRRSVHGVGVSSESTADISTFDVGEGQARTALDLKQMERSTAKNPFFKDLDAEAKSQLFEGMHVEEFSAGDIIIQQGDTDADKFYVIKSGR